MLNLLIILALFLSPACSLEDELYLKQTVIQISVEQGDTYTIYPEDYQLYDFFRGNRTSGAQFVTVPAVGSLEDRWLNGTSLSIEHGLVEHIAVHPNQQYVYFFHRNASGSVYNYVELFQISDLLTSDEPKFIRAASWNLMTHIFPDRSYSYTNQRDQFLLLSSTSQNKITLMNVTSPAGIEEAADLSLPSDTTKQHGYFDLYLDHIIVPVRHNQLAYLQIDMFSQPITIFEISTRFEFANSAFLSSAGLDTSSVVVSDVTVDGGHSLLYAVIQGQGIAVLTLALFQIDPASVEIIHYEAIPNVREIETNPHNHRILICTVIPSDSLTGDVLEYRTSGSTSSDFEMSLRFNQTNVFTAKNVTNAPSHTLYSSPEIATVDARYSFQVASNLPAGMEISTLSETSDLAVALVHSLNNTWMILAEQHGSEPNMQDINLYSVQFTKYVVWINPGYRYLGNFEAFLVLEGATCDFNKTGYLTTRPTSDSYCALQMAVKVEVKGYALSRLDGLVIGVLVVILLAVIIVVGVIVGRFCAAKRKIKREKYKRGIPDEIDITLENDEIVFGKGFTFSNDKELFKVDEAPADEEVTPSRKVVFQDEKEEEKNRKKKEEEEDTSEEREEEEEEEEEEPSDQREEGTGLDLGANAYSGVELADESYDIVDSAGESPIKPRNIQFSSPATMDADE